MTLVLGPLYPILDLRICDAAGGGTADALVQRAVLLASVGVPLMQLRAKNVDASVVVELARAILAQVSQFDCRLLINDRVDVAAICGAHGVHLGDSDLPPKVARDILGPLAIIGYSTHSSSEAACAPPEADYLGFGPVAESPTKAGVRSARGMEALAMAAKSTTRPVVAIGGATADLAGSMFAAGAASIAVISELERSDNPAALVQAYTKAMRS
ncbi:MAG: thiamine-phosphate pyrophosphorylase [Hyphomicrobiaceae bacterium]